MELDGWLNFVSVCDLPSVVCSGFYLSAHGSVCLRVTTE